MFSQPLIFIELYFIVSNIVNLNVILALFGMLMIFYLFWNSDLIYVTFLELVPHEFMGDVQNGPVKVFVMALGFATMAAFQLMDYDVVFIKPGISIHFLINLKLDSMQGP